MFSSAGVSAIYHRTSGGSKMAEPFSDGVRLSTGKEIYANHGYVGINERGELSEGYDGDIGFGDFEAGYDDNDPYELTPAERHELADYVIGLWQRYKARNPL
jgi:hypothetical protein